MAETLPFFNPLYAMFRIKPKRETAFFLKLDHSDYFLHVVIEKINLLHVELATFTAYRGTPERAQSRPIYDFCLNAHMSEDGVFRLTAADGMKMRPHDDEMHCLTSGANWLELAERLRKLEDTTFHPIAILFFQMAHAYKGLARFRLLDAA